MMGMDAVVDLSVIIVSWKTCALLRQCLESVFAQSTGRPIEVWVFDNASRDGSVEMVRELFPAVHLIENQENIGFAPANNLVYPYCRGRYILLLNPDTLFRPSALVGMLDYVDAHPEVGALGPRLVDGDGTFQLSVFPFPTLTRELWRLFHLDRLKPYALYNVRRWDLSQPHEVDSIQGACLLIRREVIQQVGLFDPDFFLYSEEIDLCYRIKHAGWKLVWLPDLEVVHFGGQSSRQEARKSFLNLYRGKIRFFHKNYGQVQAWLYRCILSAAAVIRLAASPMVWLLEPASHRRAHLALAANYWSLLKAIPHL